MLNLSIIIASTIPDDDPFFGVSDSFGDTVVEAVKTTGRHAPLVIVAVAIMSLVWIGLTFGLAASFRSKEAWKRTGRTILRFALWSIVVVFIIGLFAAASPKHDGWDAGVGFAISVGAGLLIAVMTAERYPGKT